MMMDSDEKQARFQKITNDIILRKIKQQGPSQKKERHQPKCTLVSRKPFVSEAKLKDKLLERMKGVKIHNFRSIFWQSTE